MRPLRILAVIVLAAVGGRPPDAGATLCKRKSGAVVMREGTCRKREQPLVLGVPGPPGPAGAAGARGLDGFGVNVRDATGRLVGTTVGGAVFRTVNGRVLVLPAEPSGFTTYAVFTTTGCFGTPELDYFGNAGAIATPVSVVGSIGYYAGAGVATRVILSELYSGFTRERCEHPLDPDQSPGAFRPPDLCCFEDQPWPSRSAAEVLTVDLGNFVPPFRLDGLP